MQFAVCLSCPVTAQYAAQWVGNYKIFRMIATFRLCVADKCNIDKRVMSFWNKFNEGGCSHTDGRTYSCEQNSWVRSSGWTVTNIWADVACKDPNRHKPWLGVSSVCVCHKLTVACLSTATPRRSCTEPDESSSHRLIIFKMHFNSIPSHTLFCPKWPVPCRFQRFCILCCSPSGYVTQPSVYSPYCLSTL